MPVTDIFSKRQKRLRGEVPDVYQYDEIPDELRVQVIHILEDAFGRPSKGSFGHFAYPAGGEEAYAFLHETLCRAYGVFTLHQHAKSHYEAVMNFLLQTEETEEAIDVIQLSFQLIDRRLDRPVYLNISPDDAVEELNHRFREHGVGYQYESGQIIRVDSQYLHSEAVKPALTMLSDSMYQGANAEFLSAHEHYRAKRYKECLNDCLKAFESCLKAICDKRGWTYGAGDTANRLVDITFKNKLIPNFMQSHFSALRKTLTAGVPALRNELGGHGQGAREISVPEHIATYALHLTASNILFIVQANEKLT